MNKKTLSLILLAFILISGYVPIVVAHNAPYPTNYDPTHAVVDTISEPETVDPAWCYDTGSAEVIFNVYETMLFHDTIWTDGPYAAGKSDVFKALLATDVAILLGPAGYVKTFYFHIRGVDPAHTYQATGSPVDLFKDGQIYSKQIFVRDPDYGKPKTQPGPIKTASEIPLEDTYVDRSNVPGKAYTGASPPVGKTLSDMVKDTTWIDTTPGPSSNTGAVICSVTDVNSDNILNAGDHFELVRKGRNDGAPWMNLAEYWTVSSVNPGPPYTITATADPVHFHNGALLTTADVEYSWERWLVQDRDGGPQWMLYYPMLNTYAADPPWVDPNFGVRINNAIESNATHAWISVESDFPEATFLQIMSQSWASIVNKAWAVAKGDFDGDWTHSWQYIWDHWHNPTVSHIEFDMMGTGPYKFDYWQQGTAYSIIKNDDYWDGWPAKVSPTGTEREASFVSRVTWHLLTSWTTRRERFLTGDSDFTVVPRQYRDQVLGQVVGGEKVRCFYPIEPQLTVEAEFFNFDINPQSPYLGPGFDPNNPYVIAANRIPINLFNDVHVRKGFAAAFDYATFLSATYLGEAEQPSDPIISGMSYDNPAQSKPVYDMTRAESELRAAWGGQLWANGMTFTLLFNSGNVARETATIMLRNSINGLNSKFHLVTQEVPWGGTYLPQMVAGMLPLFSIGWRVDYPDPDNFAFPFMHTYGTFSQWQQYSNQHVDELIEAGALTSEDTTVYIGELDHGDPRLYFNNYPNIPPDTRWPKRSIYYELQAIYAIDDVPGFCLDQAKGREWQQVWVRGWYYNPVYTGGYFHHLWKAKTHFADANNDQVVNILDGATVSASWSKPAPDSTLGPLGYKIQADLTGGTGGTTGPNYGLVTGIHDGKVSVVDTALVSAYWDGPPKGPLHP